MYNSVSRKIVDKGAIAYGERVFEFPAAALQVGDSVGIVKGGQVEALGIITKLQIIGGNLTVFVNVYGRELPRRLNEIAKEI